MDPHIRTVALGGYQLSGTGARRDARQVESLFHNEPTVVA
jgi:hypothetical protein